MGKRMITGISSLEIKGNVTNTVAMMIPGTENTTLIPNLISKK